MGSRRREEIEALSGVDLARLARRGGGSLVYTVLVLAAVVLGIGISMRVRKEWDLSREKSNSLSPQTRSLLGRLDRDVHLYALFSDDRQEVKRESFFYLLQGYRRVSPRVQVEFIDPVSRPGRVKDLGLDPEQENAQVDGVTLAVQGNRRIVFEGTTEEDVTNALLEVGSNRTRVVGFLRGYGEKDAGSTGQPGLSSAAQALESEYYKVQDVVLSEGIPAEVTVLIAPGPMQPIPEGDLKVLETWLEAGGRLLALLDPGSQSGLEVALEPWGLRPLERAVFDPTQNVNGSPEFVKVTEYGRQAAVRGFNRSYPTVFPLSGAVEDFEPGDQQVYHDWMARSSKYSIGVDSAGTRSQGPFTLAAASWRSNVQRGSDSETRIVLVGDSEFATNTYLPAYANRNFFLNCVAWLSRAQELVSMRQAPGDVETFSLAPGDRGKVLLACFAAPILLVLAGVAMFVIRRGL